MDLAVLLEQQKNEGKGSGREELDTGPCRRAAQPLHRCGNIYNVPGSLTLAPQCTVFTQSTYIHTYSHDCTCTYMHYQMYIYMCIKFIHAHSTISMNNIGGCVYMHAVRVSRWVHSTGVQQTKTSPPACRCCWAH